MIPHSIWPPPREVLSAAGESDLATHLTIRASARGLDDVVATFARRLAAHGIDVHGSDAARPGAGAGGTTIDLEIASDGSLAPQGYELDVSSRIAIRAADVAGARHALATLAQHVVALERAGERLRGPRLHVRDAPDFAVRGILLDVSRTRVPTLETLLSWTEEWAAFKVNQLQLYTEHAFAYAGHEDAWRDASPITPADVDVLDAHCAALGIELVPNQQSFGHMHRWLKHPRYRDLAEVPEGVEHAFSLEREPYSLDLSDPRASALLEDLYDQLLPHFRSREFNVGLDETFDLGQGRAAAACTERGRERVYLEYVKKVHALVAARGRRMQFWGDVILTRPELVRELPRDLIALEWGYDAGHPFAEHVEHFRASGLTFDVCPGTSSWQSVGGRTRNMLANLREAARCGRAAGARGYLVTDWGDRGHLQPRAISSVGLCAGAGFAWNASGASANTSDGDARAAVAAALDRHVFGDDARVAGELALALGDAADACGSPATNGSALFFLLAFAREPLPHARTPGLTDAGLAAARAHLVALRPRLDAVRSRRVDGPARVAELRWVLELLVFACDFGRARLAAPAGASASAVESATRRALAERLRALVAEHRALWLRCDRPGGLAESAGWLERVLALLEA